MTFHRLIRLVLAVGAIAIGVVLSQSAPVSAQTPRDQPVRLPGHTLRVLPAATKLTKSPSVAGEPLTLTIVLKRFDQAGFESYLKDVQNPGSPTFRRFRSRADLTGKFGPTPQAYDAVLSYLQQNGFTLLQGSDNRLTLTLTGTRAQAEQAFGVQIDDYLLNGRTFFANDTDPAVPAAIAPFIQAVVGLANLAEPRPNIVTQPVPEVTAAAAPARTPMALAQAYNFAAVPATGAGQKIGLLEFDNFSRTDVSNWLSYVGLPSSLINHLSSVAVAGGTQPSGGAGTTEALLDIDTVMGMAQGANYVVYDTCNCSTGASFQTMFNTMIGDGDTVISNSWSYCENQSTLADAQGIDSVLAQAAASGVSVFTASGDNGSACNDGSSSGVANTIGIPADAPHGTAVGGTTLQVGTGGAYQGETWWNNGSGAGGFGVSGAMGTDGVSVTFAAPSYQAAFTNSTTRSVPDVSADADPNTGIVICQGSCGAYLYGGTSMAAPEWAAGIALINQAQGKAVGNLNSVLYAHAGSNDFHAAGSMGSNFPHVGLGSFNLGNLNIALGGSGATAPGAPTGVSATAGNAQASVSWTAPASNGGSAISSYSVTTTGPSAPAAVTVSGSPPATSATITGLTNGDSYTFTVTASNSVGPSPASQPSSSVTPSAPPPTGQPMGVSGYTNSFTYTSRTVVASVGGASCASFTQTYESYYSFSLPSSCGTAGQAVTFTVGGQPAGVQTSSGGTCLVFQPGTSATSVRILAGGTPNTSCGS